MVLKKKKKLVVITNEARTTVNIIILLVVSFDAYAAVLPEHFWPWEKPSLLLIDEQCENTEILFSMCQQTQPRWFGYGRAHVQRSKESVHLFEAQIPELLFRMAQSFTTAGTGNIWLPDFCPPSPCRCLQNRFLFVVLQISMVLGYQCSPCKTIRSVTLRAS